MNSVDYSKRIDHWVTTDKSNTVKGQRAELVRVIFMRRDRTLLDSTKLSPWTFKIKIT